jgi:hypothetical protein
VSELIANCPRCDSKKITFDLYSQVNAGSSYGWKIHLEVFCVCRGCNKSTIFLVSQKEPEGKEYIEKGLFKLDVAANQVVSVERFISVQDNATENPPEHLPENIDTIFREGASCMAIGCNNAAATMFRLCLDLATQSLLPEEAEGLNSQARRSLGLRLPWLFDNGTLPEALRELSACIKDDGNDGAHEGTLSEEDAADILDFTFILLERLYAEPKRVELAGERRAARRKKA